MMLRHPQGINGMEVSRTDYLVLRHHLHQRDVLYPGRPEAE